MSLLLGTILGVPQHDNSRLDRWVDNITRSKRVMSDKGSDTGSSCETAVLPDDVGKPQNQAGGRAFSQGIIGRRTEVLWRGERKKLNVVLLNCLI